MATRVLAGDVGGTKTDLGLYESLGSGDLRLIRAATFASRSFACFEDVLGAFLDADRDLAAAAFGLAGPVVDGIVQVTNLPWRVAADGLSRRLGCPVRLLNDLEATALATIDLGGELLETLQAGVAAAGNRCVIAAGTGLGQAVLFWDGARHWPCASEGGHADFAPRDATEVRLFEFLRQSHSRVSWESVLSGPGLHRMFEFTVQELGVEPAPRVVAALRAGDPSRAIGGAALARECAAAERAVALFVSLYGAQAGNLALTTMATGGVYVAGGIVLRLLPLFRTGAFVTAFDAKQPMAELLERIPVHVVLDPHAARTGSARAAADLV